MPIHHLGLTLQRFVTSLSLRIAEWSAEWLYQSHVISSPLPLMIRRRVARTCDTKSRRPNLKVTWRQRELAEIACSAPTQQFRSCTPHPNSRVAGAPRFKAWDRSVSSQVNLHFNWASHFYPYRSVLFISRYVSRCVNYLVAKYVKETPNSN